MFDDYLKINDLTPDDIVNDLNQTLIIFLARINKIKAIQYLQNVYGKDIDINHQDKNGFSALHHAVANKNI